MDSTRVDHPTKLSIRIDTDGFSFLFYDDSNRFVSKKHVQVDLYSDDIPSTLFQSQAEFRTNYVTINISCVSPYYSLIPMALFQTDLLRPLLQLHCPDLPTSYSILYHQIESQQSVLIYALPQGVVQTVSELFPNQQIKHYLKQIIQEIPEVKDNIMVFTGKNDSDIIVFSNKKILLLNNFQHECSEDLAYYIINCIHELELDSVNCTTTLFGTHTAEVSNLLTPHISRLRTISKSEQDENYQWSI